MKPNLKFFLIGCTAIFILSIGIMCAFKKEEKKVETNEISGIVLKKEKDQITIQDDQNIIYTFHSEKNDSKVGDEIILTYTGILRKNQEMQENKILQINATEKKTNDSKIPTTWLDNGIFSQYYTMAYNKLRSLTLEEKIGQLFLARYAENSAISDIQKYHLGGILFFEKDFQNKTEQEVKDMINKLQNNSKIPLLTAVDEEGGKVVRISSNPNLVSEKFKSSQDLYQNGGFEAITKDTKNKSYILKNLGLNLNLAPVVDVSTNPSDYIYERSFGKNTDLTSKYAQTVISAGKGTGVSYTLKHFPGYSGNTDTHNGTSVDDRPYEEIADKDIPPFESGIKAGAEATLVSHNIIKSIDQNNPASLSATIHNLLRNDLGFTGIIMTDNLDMKAVSNIDDVAVKAILAGNDLIITTNYQNDIDLIKKAVNQNLISESTINKLAFRILSWKYYKGLIYDNEK